MLEVRLLGQFDIHRDGQPIALPSRPAQALLAYLLVHPGTPHPRDKLAGLFWPDAPEANARNNLRQAVWHLRKALGHDYLLGDEGALAFNVHTAYWLDVAMLDSKEAQSGSAEDLMGVVGVYGGELLPGFYDEWVVWERERLQTVFEHKLRVLLERLVDEGRWAEVLEWGERWIALGHVPEPAYRTLMVAHAALDDISSVAAVFQRCVETLRKELGVEPSAQTRGLYERLSKGEPFPERGRVPAGQLRAQATPFIGREPELAEIARLLQNPACRLLTLAGPGGIGKTRLALQAAAERQRAFPQGAYFASLAPLTSAEFLVPAIASALEFTFGGPTDPKEQLLSYLRHKDLLLVLDNFEHLLAPPLSPSQEGRMQGGDGLLTDILTRAPRVKLLVTSRERLNLHGEWVFEVEGMRYPQSEKPQAAHIEDYSAVQLFLQSARRARAGFTATGTEGAGVVRICQLVAGMPLAIELAAAWVRTLSCAEIATEIERSLGFLATSLRDVPERHQSMRAVFDHSWGLLCEEERGVFSRLSVFRGGFTREAAEPVAGASLPVLSALMDKSLLRRTAAGRYEVHELLRQYAQEKLPASGDAEAGQVRQGHLGFFLKLAERAEPELRGPEQVEWLDRLEAEHDNLRAALSGALESDVEVGLRLAGALLWFWHIRGHKSEGCDWLERALSVEAKERGDRPLLPTRALLRAKALNVAGFLMHMRGHMEQGVLLQEESLALFRELGPAGRRGMAYALRNLGWVAYEQQDYGRAKALEEESLALFQEVGDKFGIAECVAVLVNVALGEGDYERARTLGEEHLALRKEIGDKDGISLSLFELGNVAFWQSDYKRATPMYEESLAVSREMGNGYLMGAALYGLGRNAWAQGDKGQATKRYEEALAQGRAVGDEYVIALVLHNLGEIARSQGDYGQAAEKYEEALALAREMGVKDTVASTLCGLGEVALVQDDYGQAAKRFEEALAFGREMGGKLTIAIALHGLGKVAQSEGDYASAHALYAEALAIQRGIGDRGEIVRSLEALAAVAVAQQQAEPSPLRFEGLRRAARLFGAAEVLCKKQAEWMATLFGLILLPVEHADRERDVAAVRAALGEEAFAAAWAAGRAMTLEQTVAYALEGSAADRSA